MQDERSIEERTVRKVTRRLLPFLFILYVIAFLDRVNFGYGTRHFPPVQEGLHWRQPVFSPSPSSRSS